MLKLSWAYIRNNEFKNGIKFLKKTIELDPENVVALTKLGEILLRKEETRGEAETYLKKALAFNPEHTDAIVAVGKIMDIQGNNEKAIELYEKALKLPGKHVHTYFYLGVLNEKMESYKKAINYFKSCLGKDNMHYMCCMHLATLLANAGMIHRAKKYYLHALSINPDSIEAHFSLGKLIQNSSSDPSEALKHLNFVIEKEPRHHKALCQLGILYCEKNDKPNATLFFKKCLEIKPKYVP